MRAALLESRAIESCAMESCAMESRTIAGHSCGVTRVTTASSN